MAKRPGTFPLVGLSEVAQLAGVTKGAIHNWMRRYADFPRPVAELACGPIWWRPSIVEWLAARQEQRKGHQ